MEKCIIGIIALCVLLCVVGVIISLLVRNAKMRRLINLQRAEIADLRKKLKKANSLSLAKDTEEGISIH